MDLNSLKSNSSRNTFLSRVYTTPQPSSNPRAYLSTTRPRANTPSFFGKNIPHSAGRSSESHLARAVLQRGDSSAPLRPADTEDGSIYAGHKNHRYVAHRNEDTPGAKGMHNQYLSSDELSGDRKQEQDSGRESALYATPSITNSTSTLTAPDHPLVPGCTPPDLGVSPGITPTAEAGGEDEIPDSIRKSFKELRSVKDELERQRGENERLRAELAVTQKEASDTLARLDEVKQRKKRSIESTSTTLAELRMELASLKSQSDESFAFAAQARSSLPDISDLRVAIKDSSEYCHHVIEDLSKSTEMKTLIRDLELECANGWSLLHRFSLPIEAYAMERLHRVEYAHANQTDALRVALDDLHNASTAILYCAIGIIVDLAHGDLEAAARIAKLDATQKELSDALTARALAKESMAQLEKRAEKLIRDAEEKALVTAALQKSKRFTNIEETFALLSSWTRNAEMQALLKDRESSVASVLSLKEESVSIYEIDQLQLSERLTYGRILTMLSSSSDHRSELDTLRRTLAGQLQTIGELNGRRESHSPFENALWKQELVNQSNENAALRAVQDGTSEREILLKTTMERLNIEKSAVEAQSQELQNEIRRVAEERKQENDRMTQLQMRCHALQERFEDQSISLKLARENHGDMQERLIAAEAAFAVRRRLGSVCFLTCHHKAKLEAATGKLRQDVLAIQERNDALQRSAEDYRRQLESQQELSTVMRSEFEKRLKDEQDGGHSRMQALQGRTLQADMEKAQAVKEVDGLRDALTTTQSELTTLREQLQNIQTSIAEWRNQVNDLTVRNHALQAENVALLERGNTIGARYDANDLSIEEKSLVNRILEESRSFHEKRIMDQKNELRRRFSVVTASQPNYRARSQDQELEKGLARYLKSQGPKFTTGGDAQSILNLSKFASSSSPSRRFAGEEDVDNATLISGASTAPQPACALLQTSELLKDLSDEVRPSCAAAQSALSSDCEGDTNFSRPAQESLAATKDLASDTSSAVKLGKHDRSPSQTSQRGAGNNGDATRPQRRQKYTRKLGPQTSELKYQFTITQAEPETKPRPRKRK
ncbi:hypothetical protein BC826DRAFT_965799 [Russula brevipes]|nr:hypothetical protein BC826DRAFT_965799 [Russula brevipes]